MLESKAIKESSRPSSKMYLWWIQTPVADFYYEVTHKYITNPIFQIKRLYQWYINVFHNDFDFDGHSMFAIIEYKLKRIEKSLERGFSIQEPKDQKALKLAIKLAGRLKDDGYYMAAHKRIENKWGELRTWSTPHENRKDLSNLHFKYEKTNTPEEEALCWKDRKDLYLASGNKTKREEKWLYDLLHKYLRSWWD